MSDTTRPTVIAANWKMHKLRGEALEYVGDLSEWVQETLGDSGFPSLQIVVAPAFTSLEACVEANPAFGIFAQNMHQEEYGAFTGEVSAAMLRDVGVHGVILGHSERRQYFGETDEALATKVDLALAFHLRPLLCVGETLERRTAGDERRVVEQQMRTALGSVDAAEADGRLYIAYEPVWAIGTGETASPQQAQQMHAAIRDVLADVFDGEVAQRTPVLYGGSVKPANAAELLAQPDIDGALVGGAALDVPSFTGIVEAAMQQLAGARA